MPVPSVEHIPCAPLERDDPSTGGQLRTQRVAYLAAPSTPEIGVGAPQGLDVARYLDPHLPGTVDRLADRPAADVTQDGRGTWSYGADR